MKRFGLIGHPIARSLSPELFKAAYGGKYAYDLIQGDDFEASYQRFLDGYDGINVTAPFKEAAYARADLHSDECHIAKATNLLIKTPEGVKAYNSDLLGLRLWIQEVLVHISGEMPVILIVGCGGAGKAAAAAAATLDLKVILMNRNQDRAENLAEDLRAVGYDAETRPISDFCRSFREADMIIYTIPTAIEEIKSLTDSDFAPGRPKYTMEANYKNPSFDEDFIKRMTTSNPQAHHSDGRTWLLYQAVTGYEIFTGEKPDLEKMSSVL